MGVQATRGASRRVIDSLETRLRLRAAAGGEKVEPRAEGGDGIRPGGRPASQRMGGDKGAAALGGATLLDHGLMRLRSHAAGAQSSSGARRRYVDRGVPVHTDHPAGAGALGGVYTGLSASTGLRGLSWRWICPTRADRAAAAAAVLATGTSGRARVARRAGAAVRGLRPRTCLEPFDDGRERAVAMSAVLARRAGAGFGGTSYFLRPTGRDVQNVNTPRTTSARQKTPEVAAIRCPSV
jgi:hypothetical protein